MYSCVRAYGNNDIGTLPTAHRYIVFVRSGRFYNIFHVSRQNIETPTRPLWRAPREYRVVTFYDKKMCAITTDDF